MRTIVNTVRFIERELSRRPEKEGLIDLDRDRITWSHPRYAFKVYPVCVACKRKGYKLFHVSRCDPAGNILEGDAALLENKRVLRSARKYWNDADEILGEPRYPKEPVEVLSLASIGA